MHLRNLHNSHSLGVRGLVKVDVYKVIQDAVERGVRYGYSRAHKHVEHPGEEHLCQEVYTSVMNELCDLLKFEES